MVFHCLAVERLFTSPFEMNSKPYTVHIYEGEAGLISKWTLQYYNIETGGDLFGLWLSESEVVIQAVLGPGQNCRRHVTSFFQDEQYLSNVGGLLTNNEGLCNVGSWHSHHTMNIPDPSRGDKDTVWRHLPSPGRFLLLIAIIDTKTGSPKVQMGFSLFESTNKGNKIIPMKLEILQGQSPIRENEVVSRKMLEGSEVHRMPYPDALSPSKLQEKASVKKSKVAGPEVNTRKQRKPDVKENAGHDDCSGFFKHQPSTHRGHRKSNGRSMTCDRGVHSSSLGYGTFPRANHSDIRTLKLAYKRPVFTYSVCRLPDGREKIILLHFGHPLGCCEECRSMVVRRTMGGDMYAEKSQEDCCTIL